MTNVPLAPPPSPNLITRLVDLANRAIHGQLHLPPWWLRDVGGNNFEATGREFLGHFISLAQLEPDEHVLEIGCGSGRMALPLTSYLSQRGSYTGMDITSASIQWCREHITRRYANFQFLHADLYNKRYNPGGRYHTKDYRFPFPDQNFDFIILTSVFTHLLPEDLENYLREVARLTRPNGRSLVTFFLLNDTQQQLAQEGRNDIAFKYGSGPYRIRSEDTPESAVAYNESYLREAIARCGLELTEPAYYGVWSGRAEGLSYQDILLIRNRF